MRRTDLLTVGGITQSILEWALDYGITPEMIMARLRGGMKPHVAVAKPMRTKPGDRLPDLLSLLPGAVADLEASKGTGAGSNAQETPETDFSNIEVSR
ncbi:hypothetical protein ABGN05_23140 [Aquibium sp. LZ166]|uniref:Uncharacterized protein n=1 Tax=Aquibium pacificus TaxID=3153579 RepID=A0ABV3SSP1_9HYPH